MKDIIILIVEDDPIMCERIQSWLKPLGTSLIIVHTLQDAFVAMEAIPPPQFIFLDLNLPDSQREKTVNAITIFRSYNPKCSIGVLTGLRDDKIQQMATTLGAAFRDKTEVRSQEEAWKLIEEMVHVAELNGLQPYEATTKILARINQVRLNLVPLSIITA
jgi:CheY-like chemotaxis protein